MRLRVAGTLALVILIGPSGGLQTAAGAQQPAAALPTLEPDVTFYSPRPGRPAVGDVEVWVGLKDGLDASQVVFRADGREVARFREPPYRAHVDVGDDNLSHRFEVIVRNDQTEIARGLLETPSLRIDDELDLELRQLYVTVTQKGERVTTLTRRDFTVLEDGKAQTLVTFEGGDAALAAVLLIDASTSMAGEPLRAALAGARAFMEGLETLDEAALLLFSDHTVLASPFLPAGKGLDSLLADVRAGGGSAVNDHLFAALKMLDRRQGRRVAILLSDGVDIESVLDAGSVLWTAQRSQSIVYWIELRPVEGAGYFSQWHNLEEHAAELAILHRLIDESGGRVITIADTADAPRVFAEILDELRDQYVLGYYPTIDANDGSWRSVRVNLNRRPGHKVRTRLGYWDVP